MYRCVICGQKTALYFDQCPECGRFETCSLVKRTRAVGTRLSDVRGEKREKLFSRPDWDEVLGGSLFSSTIVLVSGAPGAGKTSDCLDLACRIGTAKNPALYLASEWDLEKLATRGRELSLPLGHIRAELIADIESACDALSRSSVRLAVIDSWGSICGTSEDLDLVRSCMGKACVLVVLHATKDGDFAGEERLLHKADALVWVEPDRLRIIKNWHGPPELEVDRISITQERDLCVVEVRQD